LLVGEKSLELWRGIASAGYLAELTVIENARATQAVKECWKHRLQVLKKDLVTIGCMTEANLEMRLTYSLNPNLEFVVNTTT
jgi:hypothetical protein